MLLEIGRIGGVHGVAGDVVVGLTTNRLERLQVGSQMVAGGRVLEVESCGPQRGGRREKAKWIVRFAGVDNRSDAEALRGCVLLAKPLEDTEELWVHQLIGASVFCQLGRRRGIVASVISNPASDLLELDDGSLIPCRFISGTPSAERIDVAVPDGIFNLTHGRAGD